MTNLLSLSSEVLSAAGYETRHRNQETEFVAFEGESTLGFVFSYESVPELAENWSLDVDKAVASHQFALRRAGQKAWNVYAVLLSPGSCDPDEVSFLAGLEEDLSATRKIARANVADLAAVRTALLPLLPIQTAPRLEAVDTAAEVRQRTTELPKPVVDAFLSESDLAIVMRVLEESA